MTRSFVIYILIQLPAYLLGAEVNVSQCEQVLTPSYFQTKVVRSEEEQWSTIKEFVELSESRKASPSQPTITLVISLLNEDMELNPIEGRMFLAHSHADFVNLGDLDLEHVMRSWTVKSNSNDLILFGHPKDFISDYSLNRYIDKNIGIVDLILISRIGESFPIYTHALENRLMVHTLNSTMRVYFKPARKKTTLISEDPQNSRTQFFMMNDDVQRIDGNRFEMRLGAKRERGDTTTLAWGIFREWIQSTPVTEMRREFDVHPGFIYLLEQLMRAHSAKNKNGFWWQAFSKEDYTKLISAGIISPRFKDLVSVLGQTEAKRLIELSKINKFTQKTKQSNMTNDEGENHD
jgi:hypothetical protein